MEDSILFSVDFYERSFLNSNRFRVDMEKDGGGAAEDGDPLLDKFKPKLKLLVIPSGSNQKKALAR